MAAKANSGAVANLVSPVGLGRFLFFLAFWIILIGWSPSNLAIGIPTAAVTAWVSLQFLSPAERHPSYGTWAGIILRLPWQSLVAGIDVARRALDPRMPLQTGFVAFSSQLPPGPARDAFRALMSLQPGTLPVSAEDNGDILFHCLDVSQPIAEQFAVEETRFLRAIGQERRDV